MTPRHAALTVWICLSLALAACGTRTAGDVTSAAETTNELTPGAGPGLPAAPPPVSRAGARPSGVPATAGVIVQAGDSIGVGVGAGNWAAIEHLGLPRGIAIHNVSVVGEWMQTGLGEREAKLFRWRDPRHASVLVIQQGTNDLANGSTAAHLGGDVLRPFVATAQAAGFYVVVDTILPRSDAGWAIDGGHERERLAYNRLVRANTVGADAINDIAADPVIGDDADLAASHVYADGIHLARAGQERLAKIEAGRLATMLQYPPRAPTR